MDDALFDVYEDLDEFDYKVKFEEAEKDKHELQKKLDDVSKKVSSLENEKEEMLQKIANLEKSFHSLLETARAEVQRKDAKITEMRTEMDNMAFRREGNRNKPQERRYIQAHTQRNHDNNVQPSVQQNIDERQPKSIKNLNKPENNPFRGTQQKLPQDVTKGKYLNESNIKNGANKTEDKIAFRRREHDSRQPDSTGELLDSRAYQQTNEKDCSRKMVSQQDQDKTIKRRDERNNPLRTVQGKFPQDDTIKDNPKHLDESKINDLGEGLVTFGKSNGRHENLHEKVDTSNRHVNRSGDSQRNENDTNRTDDKNKPRSKEHNPRADYHDSRLPNSNCRDSNGIRENRQDRNVDRTRDEISGSRNLRSQQQRVNDNPSRRSESRDERNIPFCSNQHKLLLDVKKENNLNEAEIKNDANKTEEKNPFRRNEHDSMQRDPRGEPHGSRTNQQTNEKDSIENLNRAPNKTRDNTQDRCRLRTIDGVLENRANETACRRRESCDERKNPFRLNQPKLMQDDRTKDDPKHLNGSKIKGPGKGLVTDGKSNDRHHNLNAQMDTIKLYVNSSGSGDSQRNKNDANATEDKNQSPSYVHHDSRGNLPTDDKNCIENSNCDLNEIRKNRQDRNTNRTRDEVSDRQNIKSQQHRYNDKTCQRRESRDERTHKYDREKLYNNKFKNDDRSRSSHNDNRPTKAERDDKRSQKEYSSWDRHRRNDRRDSKRNSEEKREHDRQSDRKDRSGETGKRRSCDRDRRDDRTNSDRDRRKGGSEERKNEESSRTSAEKKDELVSNNRKREREDKHTNSFRSNKRKKLDDDKDRSKYHESKPITEVNPTNVHDDINSYTVDDLHELQRILKSKISIEEQQEITTKNSANDKTTNSRKLIDFDIFGECPLPMTSQLTDQIVNSPKIDESNRKIGDIPTTSKTKLVAKSEPTTSSRKGKQLEATDAHAAVKTADKTNTSFAPAKSGAESIRGLEKDKANENASIKPKSRKDCDASIRIPEVPPNECNEGRRTDDNYSESKSMSNHATEGIVTAKSCKQPLIQSEETSNCDMTKRNRTNSLPPSSKSGEVVAKSKIKTVDLNTERISTNANEIDNSQSLEKRQNNLKGQKHSNRSGKNAKECILEESKFSNKSLKSAISGQEYRDQSKNIAMNDNQFHKVFDDNIFEKSPSSKSKQEAINCTNPILLSEDNSRDLSSKSKENISIGQAANAKKDYSRINPVQSENRSAETAVSNREKSEIIISKNSSHQNEHVHSNELSDTNYDKSYDVAEKMNIPNSDRVTSHRVERNDSEPLKLRISTCNSNEFIPVIDVTSSEIRLQMPVEKAGKTAANATVKCDSTNKRSPTKPKKFKIPKIGKKPESGTTPTHENTNTFGFHMPNLDASYESANNLEVDTNPSQDVQHKEWPKHQNKASPSHDVSRVDNQKNESSDLHNTSALISYETYLADHLSPVRAIISSDENASRIKSRLTNKPKKSPAKSQLAMHNKALTGHEIAEFKPEHTEDLCNLDTSRELKEESFKEVLEQRCSTPIKASNDSSNKVLDAFSNKSTEMENDKYKKDDEDKLKDNDRCSVEMDANKMIVNDDEIRKTLLNDHAKSADPKLVPAPIVNTNTSPISSHCNKNAVNKDGSSASDTSESRNSSSSSGSSATSSSSSSCNTENTTETEIIPTSDNNVCRSSPNESKTDLHQETISSIQVEPILNSDSQTVHSQNYLTKKQKVMVQLMEQNKKKLTDKNVLDKNYGKSESEKTESKPSTKRKAGRSFNEEGPPEKKPSAAIDRRAEEITDLDSKENYIEDDESVIDSSIVEHSNKTKLRNITTKKENDTHSTSCNGSTEQVNQTKDKSKVHISPEDLEMLETDLHYSSSDLEKSTNEEIINDSTVSIAGQVEDKNKNVKFDAGGSELVIPYNKIQILDVQIIPGGCASVVHENQQTKCENDSEIGYQNSHKKLSNEPALLISKERKLSQPKESASGNEASIAECIEKTKSSKGSRKRSSQDKTPKKQPPRTETKFRKSDHKERNSTVTCTQSSSSILNTAAKTGSSRTSSERDYNIENNPSNILEILSNPAAESISVCPSVRPEDTSQTNSSDCLHNSTLNSSCSPNTSLSDSQYEKREISTKSSNYLIEKVDNNVINVFITRKRVKKKKKT